MKKVAIVSCYFKNNYGSILQAYATQKFLDNNNIVNETIVVDKNKDFKCGKRKYYIMQIFNFSFIKTKIGMIKLRIYRKFNKGLNRNLFIREEKFKEFRNKFHFSRICHTYQELTNLSKEKYSDVVVGSDQLWLPVNVVSDYYTLNWVDKNVNKISYGTSFGFKEIPLKYHNLYSKFLKNINYLSVREKDGQDLINDFTESKVELVCDPTILLSSKEWDSIIPANPLIKDKYIFCYFLGKNKESKDLVLRLKKLTGYKIVSINHIDEYDKSADIFCDYNPFDVSPSDFINLIKNAEYIFTDSFHATVFSILYNKMFYIFRRHKTKNKNSTNSRLDTLFEILNIDKKHIITGKEDASKIIKLSIDYNFVNKKIEEFRNKSKKWFLSSLTYKKDDNKFINVDDKEYCSGCTACASACPKNAISMVEDNEGFLYPKVNEEKCISCGFCKKVCPIMKKRNFNEFEPQAFLFQNKDEDVRKTSTSGGFYSALGKYVINKGGIVIGAAFDKKNNVVHAIATTLDELKKFRGSKYVQSQLNDIFIKVKKELQKGRIVCFSGLPCQIEGLKSFLKTDYKNLILVDVMCHSVPSPLFYNEYKKYILKKMNATKILNINFRDKSKYGYKYPMMTIETDNGVYSEGIDTDPFLRAFFNDISVRPSCYNCRFKTLKRVSDLTIWDCFNINEIDKDFDDDKGTTRILAQSEKGLELLSKLDNIKLKKISIKIATSNVKEMTNSVEYNSKREEVFKDIDNFEKYFPIDIKTKINKFIRRTLSVLGIYSSIKSTAKKILRK